MLYRHHGIYIGDGRVVHYAGLAHGLRRGPVEQVSLECFAHGRNVWIQPGQRRFDRFQVVERALSRLGESRYRILTNNCEHFCEWALRDEARSEQVERMRAIPRLIGCAFASLRERVSLIRESRSLADVGLFRVVLRSDSVAMPNQTRLNLYATIFAVLGFVFLAFNHA